MQERSRRRWRIVFSMLFSALLMLLYIGFRDVYFWANDDLMMTRTLEGYAGSTVTFNAYLHPFLTRGIAALAAAFPAGHWYAWMLMFSQWLAFAVLTKCMAEAVHRSRLSEIWGYGLSGLFFALTAARMEVTYTVIAAYVVCAACAQTAVCIGYEKKDYRRGMTAAVLLAGWAYMLRMQTLPTMLCYCGLAGIAQLLYVPGESREERRKSFRRVIAAGLCAALFLGALFAVYTVEANNSANREFTLLNDARTQVNDYGVDVERLSDEQLSGIGWTRAEAVMLNSFCTFGGKYTAEAVSKAVALVKEGQEYIAPHYRIILAAKKMIAAMLQEPVLPALILLVLLTFALLFRSSWKGVLIPVGVLFFCMVQIFYLYFVDRAVTRALAIAVFPAAALSLILLLLHLPQLVRAVRPARIAGGVLAVCCIALSVLSLSGFRQPVWNTADDFAVGALQTECDSYARSHPGNFYFTCYVLDDRMYQDTASPRVQNLDYVFGWQTVTPDYYTHLAEYGMQRDTLDFTVFLRDDIRLIAGSGEMPRKIMAAIRSEAGGNITVSVEDTIGDLSVLKFSAE